MKAVLRQAHVPCFNLNPLFDEGFKKGRRYRFTHDWHRNRAGHDLAAKAIQAYLNREVFVQNRS